jgi:hypothetical protein
MVNYYEFIGAYSMKEFFLKSVRIGFSIWSENDVSDAL